MIEYLYNFAGLNKKLFLIINHFTNVSILPSLLQMLSWFFNISSFSFYYIIICLYLHRKISKDSSKFWPIYNKMVYIGITYATFGFTYAFLKFFINLPRPFCSLEVGSFITIANTTAERCLSSFPSSHTGLSVLIAYFLWPFLSMGQRVCAILIVGAVMISRITLAMHYPADILYSLITVFMVIQLGKVIFRIFELNVIKWVGERINRIYI
jgi:membrane-associated phospholipid phosphatase